MRCPRGIVLVVALGVAVSVVASSRVQAAASEDAHELLRRGLALQRDASWSASIATLERARAAGVLSSAERAECAFYLAAAYVAIGSEPAARRELALALEAQPSFEPPPFTSPKVASLLGDVARERASAPALEARPPRAVRGDAGRSDGRRSDGGLGGALELGFEARRVHPPIYGVVRYRMGGERGYREAPLLTREVRADGAVAVYAEVRPDRSGVLEYYAEALSPTGALGAGTAARPIALPVPKASEAAPRRHSRASSPWVWSAIPIGVVLGVGVGLGLFYGLRAGSP